MTSFYLNRKQNKFEFQLLYELLWEIGSLLQRIHRHPAHNGLNSSVDALFSTCKIFVAFVDEKKVFNKKQMNSLLIGIQ